MPSASEFSLTPDANVTIGGVNVAEDCSPGGLNDALRYVAAVARDSYDRIPAPNTLMPKTGGTFSGEITRSGRGGYLHHANSAQSSGQVHTLPEGTARPASAEGTIVFYYGS